VIGASLEAAPTVYVEDADQRAALESVSFEDVSITSDITVSGEAAPEDAFRMPETAGVAVVFAKAEGEKCARCWKVLPDVGTHAHAGVCGRCDAAVSELG
jgi:isoleucyl-tRNA synthetase